MPFIPIKAEAKVNIRITASVMAAIALLFGFLFVVSTGFAILILPFYA